MWSTYDALPATFRPLLYIGNRPYLLSLSYLLRSFLLPLCLPGGGGSLFLSPSLSAPSLSVLLRGPPFSQLSTGGFSDNSTFGTQTLLAMRKFLDDVEMSSRQKANSSQRTKKESNTACAECAGEGTADDSRDGLGDEELAKYNEENTQGVCTAELDKDSYPSTIDPEVVRAFRMLFNGFEEQW